MPSRVSHKIKKKKKKAVVKPLQIILLINIRNALKSSECACVYFAVLSGNGLGIWLGARLPTWARALSWTGARLSGPEAKPSHQHSIGSNLVHVASLLVCLQSSGPKARLLPSGPKYLQLEAVPLCVHSRPVIWANASSFPPANSR